MSSIKVLTFNVWFQADADVSRGLKYVSADRPARIRAIGAILAGENARASTSSVGSATALDASPVEPTSSGCPWDVVCLQEVWIESEGMALLARAREGGLAHGRWYHSAALGAGLMIISRFPFVDSRMLTYPLGGDPLAVIQGDFFVGKGAASATLDCGALGHVEVITSHLHAPGGDGGPEWIRSHRLAQAWELAGLARAAAAKGRPVIVCGDFNTVPEGLVIELLIARGELGDAWAATHKAPASTTPPSPSDAIAVNGVTCDSPLCSYTAGKHLSEFAERGRGKRLDYILFRGLTCVESAVVMTERCGAFSLSDHFGVEARFVAGASELPRTMSTETLDRASDALAEAMRQSAIKSRQQLQVFGACVALIPLLPIAASFQPLKFLNWIFVLLGILNGFGGATMLYVGFVFGRWERSALKNVLWELDARRRSRGRGA